MAVVEVVEGIIDLIKKNVIAKTPLTTDISVGDTTVYVENSFHFNSGEEIILIDNGFNVEGDPHYQVFEYARIKRVVDTHTLTLYVPTVGAWTVAKEAWVQKTIGHSPLYEERIFYGDRDVIPTEEMAITVEPISLSNEWIYLMGGLSREFRVGVMIYGKDVETEQGMMILNKYADDVYDLLMSDLHIDVNNYDTPLIEDVAAGTATVYVEDTTTNREYFVPSGTVANEYDKIYDIQDNLHAEHGREIVSISPAVHVPGGTLTIVTNRNFENSYTMAQFGTFSKHGRYMYDSRVDNVEYGTVQKGSAFIRAAKLNWFGKEVEEHRFPQQNKGIYYFSRVESSSSSST